MFIFSADKLIASKDYRLGPPYFGENMDGDDRSFAADSYAMSNGGYPNQQGPLTPMTAVSTPMTMTPITPVTQSTTPV
jgi:hypothetical protein